MAGIVTGGGRTEQRRDNADLIAALTGDDTDDWSETFTEELVINMLQNFPVVSQLTGFYAYNSVPVPAIAVMNDVIRSFERWKRTKDPDKKRLALLRLIVLSGGTAAGIPGTRQLDQIIGSTTRPKQPPKQNF